MKNYILLGMPGSGKGTMAKKLVEEFGFVHLSTGDIIRAEQKAETKIGKLADKLIDQGNFLPDEIIIELFQKFIINNPTQVGYLLDGYPRSKSQAKHVHAFFLKRKLPLDGVIYLDLPQLDAVLRLLNRAKIEGRKDDTKPAIEKRIELYKAKTLPLVEYFENMGKLYRIDASCSVEQEYANIKMALGL